MTEHSSTLFHPVVWSWFVDAFREPTPIQTQAWEHIRAQRAVLVAAPTGSGKTLAAFFAVIDQMIHDAPSGTLEETTRVVYVSPLKALSNDIHRNLEVPLHGIRDRLRAHGLPDAAIRVGVRTGDTTQAERQSMRRESPHILVTTPESLYLLLTSASGRKMLAATRTVIVDEIHALVQTKRGAHLALSLQRLEALTGRSLQRIGLSATQKPIQQVAQFLVGAATDGARSCEIVNAGHIRDRDVALELPPAPLEAVMSGEVWVDVYNRLAALVLEHRTTLIFVNTRRTAERVTFQLGERLGKENVAAHHGSLAKEARFDAEQRLKSGHLRAMVATASLELGIDIGDVDLVCQLGSPRGIAAFLQRVGRSGHGPAALPKGRLFPLSRDDLVDCVALLDCVRRGELDVLHMPHCPLDVLAQQIVAEVACEEWSEDALYENVRGAWPYRDLWRTEFNAVVAMLSDGFATRRGRRAAYLHRDAVNKRLRARKGARLTATTSGGAIPDQADYRVVLEPSGNNVGTLSEDFAIECNTGDIFQLGNLSYRVLRVERGTVRVEDARGAPPTVPFWLGEAPGRTAELSAGVARLRTIAAEHLGDVSEEALQAALQSLQSEFNLSLIAAQQLVDYLGAAKALLGELPTQTCVVLERFFDEVGNQQLVIHAPFGIRINRVWGLALRKRFCRQFNFELQAAATDDAIILSLGETHSFALDDVARYLKSRSVREVLIQALLDAPLFGIRWRWVVSIGLAVPRFRGGRKTPAPLQRILAEDLMSVVFPDGVACAENVHGAREIPDHPLVKQTLSDCLNEAMDINGMEQVLRDMERGAIRVVARDVSHPSPLAQEILNARPYAFLDDAPLEERRTQAVASRRWLDPRQAAEFGHLDQAAIERVCAEVWPDVASADELHDVLMQLGWTSQEWAARAGWSGYFDVLLEQGRATRFQLNHAGAGWVATESLPMVRTVYADATWSPEVVIPCECLERDWMAEGAVVEIVRGHLQVTGPMTPEQLAERLHLPVATIMQSLAVLEAEGFAMRGHFRAGAAADGIEFCERRLLARIHRYTIERLRAEIEPVSSAQFMRFLLAWQGISGTEQRAQGPQALLRVIEQLEGFEAPAVSWETDLLPRRLAEYDPDWLDGLCASGRVVWTRLSPIRLAPGKEHLSGPVRTTPMALLTRRELMLWQTLAKRDASPVVEPSLLSSNAQRCIAVLRTRGASFVDELISQSGLLHAQVEDALSELVAAGHVTADSFRGLRAMLMTADKKRGPRGRKLARAGIEEAGRWTVLPSPDPVAQDAAARSEHVERIARKLLARYGVVFKKMLTREAAWLPSWYELLTVYRRLEARGEIRGGRFVANVMGEQFAATEAIASLRALRKPPAVPEFIALSAADPLNLVGVLTPGARVPALAGNRILLRDGETIAMEIGGEVRFIEPLNPEDEWQVRTALLRQPLLPSLRHYAN